MTRILAIETSCDETAAAIVEGDGSAPLVVRSNTIASQAALHAQFGGVFPELAAREHAKRIVPVIGLALHEAGLVPTAHPRGGEVRAAFDSIDAIAVTVGPGLIGPLLIGTTAAAQLANLAGKPVIPVNHWEGHLYSVFLGSGVISKSQIPNDKQISNSKFQTANDDRAGQTQFTQSLNSLNSLPAFPILFLTVSGGHTSLILMRDHFEYEILGSTVDDAAGEAFDKCARLLGLPYPGGPALSKEASRVRASSTSGESPPAGGQHSRGDPGALKLPRPMLNSGDLRFSFSGLKTAVRYAIDRGEIDPSSLTPRPASLSRSEAAREIEDAIVDVLLAKLGRAIEEVKPAAVAIVGGVSANQELRRRAAATIHPSPLVPHPSVCTDNAAMIASAGLFHFIRDEGVTTFDTLSANASLRLT